MRILKIASNSSESHLQLKKGWPRYAMSYLNHWIIEEVTLQNIGIKSRVKEKM